MRNGSVKISYSIYTEVSEEKIVWSDKKGSRERITSFGRTKNFGRPYGERSHTYINRDTAEIFSCTGDGIHKREKCLVYSKAVWRTTMK